MLVGLVMFLISRVYCCWLAVYIFVALPCVLLLFGGVFWCWLAVFNCYDLAVCIVICPMNFCWLD